MPLNGFVFHKEYVNSLGLYTQEFQQVMEQLKKNGKTILDVSGLSEPEILNEIQNHKLAVKDCLFIVVEKNDRQVAKNLSIAMIGYQPYKEGQESLATNMVVEGFEEIDFSFLERVYQRAYKIPWTILETQRCVIREMTLEDLDALYELYEPEEITRYMEGLSHDRKQEEEKLKAYIGNMYGFYGYGMWAVIEKSTGKLIGRAGLEHLELEDEIYPELGYMIAKEKQNQGYASEVCKGILAYAKGELEMDKVYCRIREGNHSSVRIAEKLGFSQYHHKNFTKDCIFLTNYL